MCSIKILQMYFKPLGTVCMFAIVSRENLAIVLGVALLSEESSVGQLHLCKPLDILLFIFMSYLFTKAQRILQN